MVLHNRTSRQRGPTLSSRQTAESDPHWDLFGGVPASLRRHTSPTGTHERLGETKKILDVTDKQRVGGIEIEPVALPPPPNPLTGDWPLIARRLGRYSVVQSETSVRAKHPEPRGRLGCRRVTDQDRTRGGAAVRSRDTRSSTTPALAASGRRSVRQRGGPADR
jgi:hypothetical protein